MDQIAPKDWPSYTDKTAVVVDIRSAEEFADGHVPKSLSIPLGDAFDALAGEMLNPDDELYLVGEKKQVEEAEGRFIDLGFVKMQGQLKGSFNAWQESGKSIDMAIISEAEEVNIDFRFGEPLLIDIRSEAAFKQAHVEKSANYSLQKLRAEAELLPKNKTSYLFGNGLDEGMAAVSILKKAGVHNVYLVAGGFLSLSDSGLPLVEQKKKSTS